MSVSKDAIYKRLDALEREVSDIKEEIIKDMTLKSRSNYTRPALSDYNESRKVMLESVQSRKHLSSVKSYKLIESIKDLCKNAVGLSRLNQITDEQAKAFNELYNTIGKDVLEFMDKYYLK